MSHVDFQRFEDELYLALRRIDAEGVFGIGKKRKSIVVNLLMGDQGDEARIEFARRVNPPESVQMLINELYFEN